MATLCGRGHELHGPHDRLSDGQTCKVCHRENQARYRRRCRAGIALLAAVEGRGLSVGEAISLIQRADYWTLQECQSR